MLRISAGIHHLTCIIHSVREGGNNEEESLHILQLSSKSEKATTGKMLGEMPALARSSSKACREGRPESGFKGGILPSE